MAELVYVRDLTSLGAGETEVLADLRALPTVHREADVGEAAHPVEILPRALAVPLVDEEVPGHPREEGDRTTPLAPHVQGVPTRPFARDVPRDQTVRSEETRRGRPFPHLAGLYVSIPTRQRAPLPPHEGGLVSPPGPRLSRIPAPRRTPRQPSGANDDAPRPTVHEPPRVPFRRIAPLLVV